MTSIHLPIRLSLLFLCILAFGESHSAHPYPAGGSACVVAKKLGNSLAIEWSTGQASVPGAIDEAKQALRKRGFEYVFPQANSPLPHGWATIIKTEYRTFTGRKRTSFGCGFSNRSQKHSEELAVGDLRSYSWGWQPKHGYEVMEQHRY
jgi:hypothetical protein